MKKQLKPSFYNDFKCIADKCEIICCENWKILIDKKTYKKYMNLKGDIKKDIKKNIKINKEHESTWDYAVVKLNNKKRCSLLNEQGLCRIHAELGEDMLSHTCKVYPRQNVKVGDIYEYNLSISCPEVAKKALLDKEKFSFIFEEDYISKKEERKMGYVNLDEYCTNLLWEVRKFSIEIIQMRDIELWKRIMLLGLFCKEVDENLSDINKFIDEIEKYRCMISNEEILNSLNNIHINNDKKLNLLTQFIRSRIDCIVNNDEFIEVCNDLESALGFGEQKSEEKIIENYTNIENGIYKKFLVNNSHILENYLVNTIYREFILFYTKKSFYNRFVKVIIQYSIVRFLLIGQLQKKKETFNDNDIIKVFYSFSRVIEHNPMFMNMLIEGLKQKGYDELNYMSILIRE